MLEFHHSQRLIQGSLAFLRRLNLILCFITGSLSTLQSQPIFFNTITQQDGLRNGNVRSIVRDFQGFVWIGTEDGLHRFDGNQMKIYRNLEGDSLTISSNFILSLYEDSKHNLWIGTLDGGLCLYDRGLDNFRRIIFAGDTKATNRGVRTIEEGDDNYLYVGSDNMFRAKIDELWNMRFDKVTIQKDSVTKAGTRVLVIVEEEGPTLLVSINTQGLFKYNANTGQSYLHPISKITGDIQTLFIDKRRNVLWAGTWRDGLLAYDQSTNKYRWFRSEGKDAITKSNFIASIQGDSEGNIWVGTDNGLTLIPHDTDIWKTTSLTTYLQDQEDRSNIQGTVVKTVYIDSQDLVWAGMYYEGVNVYDRKAMNFGSLPIVIGEGTAIKFGNINALAEDQDNGLWLGVDGGGLFYLKGKLGEAHTTLMSIPCKNADKIKSMKVDHEGNLWIGTWGHGVTFIASNTKTCQDLPAVNAVVGREVLTINVDQLDNTWIGTFDKGLFRYNSRNKKTTKITRKEDDGNSVDRVNTLYVDGSNNVWLGREVGGLAFLKEGEDKYSFITTGHLNPRATILSSLVDSEGILWVGAAGKGLVRYDPKTNTSELYGEEQGLANSYVQAISEDNLQRIWISHNMGLSVFYKQNHTFTNFSRSNGLLASQYNRNAVTRLSDGRIAFGNIRGVNFFDPARFRKQGKEIPIVFTKFLLDNIEQRAGSAVLPHNITTLQEIQLDYNQNSFGIEFASLEHDFAQFREYAYMLKGYDEKWQRTDNARRLIAYTNLSPGDYTFKVMIAKNTDEQVSGSNEIHIVIVPAWWQTTWFKVLAGILALGIIVASFRLRMQYLLRQRRELARKVEERTTELNKLNSVLQSQLAEINTMNNVLNNQQQEIIEKNNEIQAQNEELVSQNEQILAQHNSLSLAQEQLKEVNTNLESIVGERTEELQRTIKDLNKTVFELDRFVYSASHDLSAPLKSIRGLVELIMMEKDPSIIFNYSGHIKNTALKLETVIRSMVDYARNAHILVKVEKFRLKDLIDEVIAELSFWPEAARINYLNLVPDDLTLMTDKARIKIVLLNLVTNGIKYSDRNKESCWMKFECKPADTDFHLTVTDNGIGIQKQYLDKIFKMYFRATESSKGSGLGLFIVSEVMDKIGGNISVQSEYGVETKFQVVIPNRVGT